MSHDHNKDESPGTTGHVWDDDLQEMTNPLPIWWLWSFYLTVIFSVIYWVLYPAWPIGDTFTKGIGNNISYTARTVDGKEVQKSTHWNTRAKLISDMNRADGMQQKYFSKVASTPFDELSSDAELMQFVRSAGQTLFSDNCRPCHQEGGAGMIGLAPNLVDDDWLYGGTYEKIQESIMSGRQGMMPPFGSILKDEQIAQLANYVLSLSGELHDAAAASSGETIFQTGAGCAACHGADGKGNPALGSANLADKVWLWANVPGQETAEGKASEVSKIIAKGMARGKMPPWSNRLSPEQVKLMTVYVHDSLGGGK